VTSSQPIYSPDGRHVWDGAQWIAVPGVAPAAAEPFVTQPGTKATTPARGLIIAALTIVAAALVFGVIGKLSQDKTDKDYNQAYCTQIQPTDPRC
jgi:hypothetical protein